MVRICVRTTGSHRSSKYTPLRGGVFESDECDRSRRRLCFRGRTCRFAADAVAQHQEWQPEEPKRVIGAQLAVRDVDIEFLFETRHPKCRQLAREAGSMKVR